MVDRLRAVLDAFVAARYPITVVVTAIVVLFGALSALGLIRTPYAVLASDLGISPGVLLILLYLVVAAVVSGLWYPWIVGSQASLHLQLQARPLVRAADPTGLRGLDGLFLLLIAAGALVAALRFQDPAFRQSLLFLAFVVAVPLILDLAPASQPRRLVARRGDTLEGLAARLAADTGAPGEELAAALYYYNNLDEVVGPDGDLDAPLPPGLVLEVPPRR